MILAKLDENNYFTGSYATVGTLEGAIEVETLPDVTASAVQKQCYRYENGTWVFDHAKYESILAGQNAEELDFAKQEMISHSRELLAEYLSSYKLTSACHAGTPAEYSITPEKQQYLSSMILTATMAAQAGLSYQPSWNAAGKPCTYDWTLKELQQLAMEMEAAVRPLISRQQQLEVLIQEAATLEDLKNIDLTF